MVNYMKLTAGEQHVLDDKNRELNEHLDTIADLEAEVNRLVQALFTIRRLTMRPIFRRKRTIDRRIFALCDAVLSYDEPPTKAAEAEGVNHNG
jgi:hypothetical protein